MEKTKLQIRAENAARLFPDYARKPIVIEFAGVPKAGKTTTLSQIQAFLKRCGFKIEVVIERASVCPIKDKKHVNFNIWTACTTLAQLLEKTQTPPRPEDPQILILDRGIFDSLCWLRMMEKLQRLREPERKTVEQFLQVSDWRNRITGVILMTVSPADSMKREQGLLPVVDGKGSIMNTEVLQQMLDVCRKTAEDMRNIFRIVEINTSDSDYQEGPRKTSEQVAEKILDWIEEHLDEDILHLPKSDINEVFSGKRILSQEKTLRLVNLFHVKGSYGQRAKVESNKQCVQALPVVVVRNASGDILRLRRKEEKPDSSLHEKIVIWAGGHVRKEDSFDGNAIPQCVIRELEEELRLRVDVGSLVLLGAVYIDEEITTSKHVAIVYEWRAQTDDVSVALSNAEFFERRGTSLSGTFVKVQEIIEDLEKGKVKEPWSETIVREFIAKDNKALSLRLI